MATTTRFSAVDFGGDQGGLGTVGYALYNASDATLHTARTTAGVTELGTSTGVYGVSVGVNQEDSVNFLWDTGAGTPIYAIDQSLREDNPSVLLQTTIATLASQTSFTLTAGSADDNAYNGDEIKITDATTGNQIATGVISDYVGSTKTVTLLNDPVIFTMAANDIVDIVLSRALKPTTDNRTVDVTASGAVLGSSVQKNVALSNFPFFMVNATDHVTAKTGLSVTGQVSIDGGALSALANTPSEIGNGSYKIDLAAADLNGDIILLLLTAVGADDRVILIRTTT